MDEVKLLAAIDAYAESAHGSDTDGGELSRQRALALDAYAGKNIEPAPEGRSQVTDMTVFETVQWIMPSLMRIFGGGDSGNIVEFDPFGPEDEEPAEQESLVLNHLLTSKNDWQLTVRTWCQDALLTKNAYCLVTMEEKKRTEIERYEGQREEQVTMLLEDEPEIIGSNQYDDPDDEGQVIDPFTGQPVQDEETLLGALATYEELGQEPQVVKRQLYDIELRQVKTTKNIVFRVLPPERCKVGEDTPDFTLEDSNYFEFWDDETTLSELRSLGYEIDDDIASDEDLDTDEDEARDANLAVDGRFETPDKSMRRVTCRWIWIRHDADEDGIAEMQHVVVVGNTILHHEPVSRIPVASIVPFINTHRHVGNSVADLVFDIQRIKTHLLRNGLDGMNLSVRPRHAVSSKVNIDDLLNSRPGGIVRLSDGAIPGEGHVMPLVTENTFPIAQSGLQHMDTVIESRVGVNRMFQGIDASNVNDHNRVGQLSTMAAQRVEDIARVFGEGFKRLFSIAHELLIKSGHSGQAIRLRGRWIDVDPTTWRTGRDMRITAPFAAGNKDSLVQRLMLHLQIHEKALAAGAPFVSADDAYQLLLMVSDATDVAGSKIYTDPATVEPPPPQPDPTMIALDIENKKADGEIADEARSSELEKYKADLDAQVRQYQTDANSQLQIALAQIKAGQSVDLERVKANLKVSPIDSEKGQMGVSEAFKASQDANEKMAETLKESVKQMSEALAKANGPKRVVREGGKIVGVEPA